MPLPGASGRRGIQLITAADSAQLVPGINQSQQLFQTALL